MGEFFICPICGNSDSRKVGYINGVPYCRACITFKGNDAKFLDRNNYESDYSISYSLAKNQLDVSNKLLMNFKNSLII